MTNSTLEKVALLIAFEIMELNADERRTYTYDDINGDTWDRALCTARDCLQSLRQVDDETVEAMIRKADELHTGCGPQVESATELHGLMFAAAIDHILGH